MSAPKLARRSRGHRDAPKALYIKIDPSKGTHHVPHVISVGNNGGAIFDATADCVLQFEPRCPFAGHTGVFLPLVKGLNVASVLPFAITKARGGQPVREFHYWIRSPGGSRPGSEAAGVTAPSEPDPLLCMPPDDIIIT